VHAFKTNFGRCGVCAGKRTFESWRKSGYAKDAASAGNEVVTPFLGAGVQNFNTRLCSYSG
jgi:hypothetical protein